MGRPLGLDPDDWDRIPDELQKRDQWLQWDASNDTPRRPHQQGDFYDFSWSDPDDWLSFKEATETAAENDTWGIGYVTALNNDDHARGLYAVIDIDNPIDDESIGLKDWCPSLQPFFDHDAYVERSPSGTGIHIPVVGMKIPDWWADVQVYPDEPDRHEGIDVLANKFCTFTGAKVKNAGKDVVEYGPWVEEWLAEAYKAINGEDPRGDRGSTPRSDDDSKRRKELTEDDVRDALDHVDADVPYNVWRDIGFALADHFETSTAKSIFKDWSRTGNKWDDDAEDYADRIIDYATSGGGRTIGTVVYHAKQGGWTYPSTSTPETPPSERSSSGAGDPDDPDDPDGGGGGGGDGDGDDDRDLAGGGEWDTDWEWVRDCYNNDDMDMKVARYRGANVLERYNHFAADEVTDTLYVYNPETGVYEERGEPHVASVLQEELRWHYSTKERREWTNLLKSANYARQDEFGGPPWHINVANGVVDVEPYINDGDEPVLKDNDPDFLYRAGTTVEFDPDAECPTWESFLKDVTTSEIDRKKLQEFAGYSLLHWAYPFHKALFIVGPGASGKSTYLDTIREILGREAVASVTPQELTEERFAAVELHGAWANMRNDIPDAMISNVGKFKELMAGDPIKVEEKHQPTFTIEPTAKHLYSTNKLPEASVDDDAFYRRILLVSFPTSVPRDDRDPYLADKLAEEYPGILNWMLDGLRRLMDQNAFTGDQPPAQTRRTWESWGSSVERFKQQCIEMDSKADAPKADVYAAYIRWCNAKGLPAVSQHKFTRKLKEDPNIDDSQRRVKGRRQRVYTGFTVIDECIPDDPDGDDDEDGAVNSGLDDY